MLSMRPWEKDERFYQKYMDNGLGDFEATLASMIESMDKSLGDIMQKVKHLGIEKNTVIIFMSDNGAPSQCPQNLPLRGHKIDPYEGGIRDPLIVKWPGVVKEGSDCNEPVIIEDFFPSILEIAGIKKYSQPEGKVDGISFVPMLTGKEGKYCPTGASTGIFLITMVRSHTASYVKETGNLYTGILTVKPNYTILLMT